MSTIAEVFEELFYGSGIWLGLLLIVVLVSAVSMKNRYGAVLCIPITLFFGLDYLANGAGTQLWGGVVMFFTTIFLIVQLMRNR